MRKKTASKINAAKQAPPQAVQVAAHPVKSTAESNRLIQAPLKHERYLAVANASLEAVDGGLKGAVDIAIHETGHAVIAHLCGAAVKRMKIVLPSDQEKPDLDAEVGDRDVAGITAHSAVYDTFRILMTCTAGWAASHIDNPVLAPFVAPNGNISTVCQCDFEKAKDVIYQSLIGPGCVQCDPNFDAAAWINESCVKSWKLLRESGIREVFDATVEDLLAHGELNEKQLNVHLSKLPRKVPRSSLYTWFKTYKAVQELLQTNPKSPKLAVYRAAQRLVKAGSKVYQAKKNYENAISTVRTALWQKMVAAAPSEEAAA